MGTLDYTTKTKIEKYLTIDIDAAFEPFVTEWISAMSRYADDYCGRVLMAEALESRVFDGDGSNSLCIDEACLVTDLQDSAAESVTDYLLYPLNQSNTQYLKLRDGAFASGLANYTVTGTWGYINATGVTANYPDNVPANLETAVTMLVGTIVNLSRSGGGGVSREKVGMYEYEIKDVEDKDDFKLALRLLDNYRRIVF